MNNVELAKKLLIENNKNLVVVKEKELIFQSDKKGIVPMYDLYNEQILGDVFVADKFVGGGAAKILLNMPTNILELYTHVISKKALIDLELNGIKVYYSRIVEKILNRTGDDLCPVEKLSLEHESFEEFFVELEKFLIKTKQIRG